jgi:hypothetical protein
MDALFVASMRDVGLASIDYDYQDRAPCRSVMPAGAPGGSCARHGV